MSIAELSSELTPDGQGIFTTACSRPLSYPENGNREYFRIEDRSLWFRHRNDCIAAIMKLFPPSGAVLDIGGGNGFVTRRMLDEGFEGVLLEPGMDGALNGRTGRGIPEVICSRLEEAGLPDSSVHAAGCFDVIEHIEEDRPFLDRIHRLLVQGGLLYATVPAHEWLWSRSDESAGHFRRYGRRATAILLDPGFEILYLSGLYGVFTLPLLVSRVLPYRLGLSSLIGEPSIEVEHGIDANASVSALYRLLRSELSALREGKSRKLGTSLLFVARKI